MFFPASPKVLAQIDNKGEVGAVGFPGRPPTYILPFIFPRHFALPGEEKLQKTSDVVEARRVAVNGIQVFFCMVSPKKISLVTTEGQLPQVWCLSSLIGLHPCFVSHQA